MTEKSKKEAAPVIPEGGMDYQVRHHIVRSPARAGLQIDINNPRPRRA